MKTTNFSISHSDAPPPIPRQNPSHNEIDIECGPPELPVKNKKNPLKSPLKSLKKALVNSAKTLRRQASFMDSSETKKQRGAVRRQQSMVERGSGRMFYSPQHHQQAGPYGHQGQDYYEYQQQQYHNYYQHQQGYYDDPRYMYQQRHERFYQDHYNENEPIYGNYNQPPRSRPIEENLYANRALIELERPTIKTGNRIIRRHSMNEKHRQNVPAFATLTKRRPKYDDELNDRMAQLGIEEPIYQSQRGSYMYHEQMKHRPVYEQRLMDDHERMMRVRSPEISSTPSPSSMSSPSRDKNRDPRRMLKEQIYQSRIDAMTSMAEPIYISKSSSGTSTNTGRSLRSQPIYESKRETEIDDHDKTEVNTSNENNETSEEKSLLEVIEETIKKNQSMEMLCEKTTTSSQEDESHQIPFADNDTQESEDKTKDENTIVESKTKDEEVKSPRPKFLETYHISNIIKMHAPPPPPIRSPTTKKTFEPETFESQTSIDTNCTSHTSLSVGLPNAQSTPYASELTLKDQNTKSKQLQYRPPITKRGFFDENGGVLEDKTWNVTLIIPPNALKTRQEIYFTVTDPRMSQSVGGPPLDMENGSLSTSKNIHNFFSIICSLETSYFFLSMLNYYYFLCLTKRVSKIFYFFEFFFVCFV